MAEESDKTGARPPWHVDWPVPDEEIRTVLERCWADGSWGRYHGPHCDALKAALGDTFGADHVILCSSGTAAIELSLRATNLPTAAEASREVILCSYDFKANYQNVLTVGGLPVLTDCQDRWPCIDPEAVAAAIGPATRCMIVSHLHGCLADIESLQDLAVRNNIVLIEDACQTPGATINGRRVGSFGDLGVLSFGGSKLLTAGRGGAILCRDPLLAQRIRLYVQRGNDAYPLSEVQAALILPQLKMLDQRERQRQTSVDFLRQQLLATDQLECLSGVESSESPTSRQNPHANPQRLIQSSYYKVPLLLDRPGVRSGTEALAARLRNRQVAVDPAFPAIHLTHSQRRFRVSGALKNSEHLHHRLMVLHHPALLSSKAALTAMTDEILNELNVAGS